MKILVFILFGVIFLTLIMANFLKAEKVDEPSYELINKFESIEIRQYKKIIVATTIKKSSYKDATYSGFRTLANYIFGNNDKEVKIPMTAPVITTMPNNESIEITFIMSADYSLDNLPKPHSDDILFKEITLGKVAVIKFGMWATPKRIMKMKGELEKYLFENNIQTSSDYLVAQYNSPWVIPPFRRNEIIISIY
tara:strand:- start:1295 stop:1879 length:585 start_codon:yes stop_codon:yes gene_type:complete